MIDYKIDPNPVVLAKRMIKQAELLREHGDTWGSIDQLMEARELIRDSGEGPLSLGALMVLAEALGHEIVCFKHLYQNTGKLEYLDYMAESVSEGLDLEIPDEQKAVFYLRRGDILTSLNEYEDAERSFQKALDLVELLENHTTAEYMGHLGESMTKNGKAEKGVEIILKALHLMNRQKVEEWHRLIIVSGLYGRLSKAALKSGKYQLAFSSLWATYKMARKLKKEHGMPQRLNHFYQRLLGRGE